MHEIDSKVCTKCKNQKKLTSFHKRGEKYKSRCKSCSLDDYKEYYYKNHEKNKEKNRVAWHKMQLKQVLKERGL